MRKARVFISCGQRTTREKNIGMAVEKYFKKRNFDTYFAELVHSSDGLTENIIKFLADSEYFVFIDFKREEIQSGKYRGSVFVNQEIAIATFIKLEGVGFLEEGVIREGILNYQLYNAFQFLDETDIFEKLAESTQDWDIDNVNELLINFDPSTTNRNVRLEDVKGNPMSDWYHLEVVNRRKDKHAFSCVGYVSRIKNLNSNTIENIPTNEFVWAGIGEISANILGGSRRELDAFLWVHGEDNLHFHQRNLFTSNPRYSIPPLNRGRYLIEYLVISSNFPSTNKTFLLEFEGTG